MQTHLQPGAFAGNVRGLAAGMSLDAGPVAISIPEALLICEDTAKQSELVGVIHTHCMCMQHSSQNIALVRLLASNLLPDRQPGLTKVTCCHHAFATHIMFASKCCAASQATLMNLM